MLCTTLSYICMRILGEGPDSGANNASARARKWILDHGSVTAIPSGGKTWLSILGVYDWSGTNPMPPEFWILPSFLPMHPGAPLLCAGITTYSPLRYFGLDKPGMHIGIVGLGGLGHLAVKFAKSFGAKVTAISTSEAKKQETIEKLGADAFTVSHDFEQMQAEFGTMDGIIDTVSAVHPITF